MTILLTARDHVVVLLRNPAADHAQYGETLHSINDYIHWSAAVVCTIIALQLGWEVVQMILNSYRKRVAAMQ